MGEEGKWLKYAMNLYHRIRCALHALGNPSMHRAVSGVDRGHAEYMFIVLSGEQMLHSEGNQNSVCFTHYPGLKNSPSSLSCWVCWFPAVVFGSSARILAFSLNFSLFSLLYFRVFQPCNIFPLTCVCLYWIFGIYSESSVSEEGHWPEH